MKDNKYYSIGEMSYICNISKKALRYYDKIGLISPDYIDSENNYRFYSDENLLSVPIIKYYKQMGFKLEEMKTFLGGKSTYGEHIKGFSEKLTEINQQIKSLKVAQTSVGEWYDMLLEAQNVLDYNAIEVSVKYLEENSYPYLEQEFKHDYMDSIINVSWTNYLETLGQEITGSVMMLFSNYHEKLEDKNTKIKIFQKNIHDMHGQDAITVGGCLVVACYHIGTHKDIYKTYNKMIKWAEQVGYKLSDESIERYVADYWATKNQDNFVTEIMIKVKKQHSTIG